MEAGKETSAGSILRNFFRFNYISLYDILTELKLHRGTIQSSGMKKLTLSDYQALAEFRYQIRRFLHFSERAVKKAGLERGQYQLMLAIKGMPAGVRPRIRELANRMQIRHHSAVELVNRLETGGFVHRARAEDDRREVLLALTAKGEKVLAELALHHREELRGSGPELVAALRRIMRESGESDAQPSIPLRERKTAKHP
jgi:DNA-binding MarR family transcriptional regulator